MDKPRNQAYEWGEQAEELAADYLRAKGYTVRERRWRYGASKKEIDIIAQQDDTMIFVEVKARTDSDTDPLEAVDSRKMRFLCFAADAYLNEQEHDYFYRFDIIGISGTPADYSLRHIEDAFLPPLMAR
ncbi:MAG: YraN family protein [Muribaculaceae bacterium]|nr:YraN family protein [Muribaculaceae bacterium]